MKVIVTFPGQYCTAPQSLTFLVGMREPLLRPCPRSNMSIPGTLITPPGSVIDTLIYNILKFQQQSAEGKCKLEPLKVFNMPAEVKLWKGKAKLLVPCLG